MSSDLLFFYNGKQVKAESLPKIRFVKENTQNVNLSKKKAIKLPQKPITIEEVMRQSSLKLYEMLQNMKKDSVSNEQYLNPTTIEDVMVLLESTVFHYEIMSTKKINDEPTIDCLYRHILEEFGGYDTNYYNIVTENDKQYLTMRLIFDPEFYDEDYVTKPATVENIKLCFSEYQELISDDGKFIIPMIFEDSIYPLDPNHPDDYDAYMESIDVEFKFSKVEEKALLEYIKLV